MLLSKTKGIPKGETPTYFFYKVSIKRCFKGRLPFCGGLEAEPPPAFLKRKGCKGTYILFRVLLALLKEKEMKKLYLPFCHYANIK